MLGEQIAEVKGKLTGQRVLNVEGPKIEYSFSANGKMKDVDINHMLHFGLFLEVMGYYMARDKE
jgi:hypothetical protein